MTIDRHRRNHEIKVGFNDNEFEELNKKFRQTKMSREKFIRHCIKKTEIKMPPSIDFYKWINKCNAIGNNLNQIAKQLNMHFEVDKNECLAVLNNLNNLIQIMENEIRG